MRVNIQIEANTPLELAELIARLAAHILKADKLKPIKILSDDGATVAELTIDQPAGKDQPA